MATPRKNYHFDETCECGACPICLELESYLADKSEDDRWDKIFARKIRSVIEPFYPTTPLAVPA